MKAVTAKRVYESPTLEVVDLAAEEVLAPGCKLTSAPSTGKFEPVPCHSGTLPVTKCIEAGS